MVRPYLLAAFLLAIAGSTSAADESLQVVTAHYRNQAQLQSIASRFQHLIVDRDASTARVEATQEEIDALRRSGIRVDLDVAATRQLRAVQDVGIESIPNYACYRTVEETYATMNRLAQTRPSLAQVLDIGPSWLKTRNPAAGYTMKVLRLTNSATNAKYPNKANMVVLSSIHAREYTPAETMTRFGEWLVNNYGSNSEATWLLDTFRFHLVLQANPDGRKRAEAGSLWRKNVNNSNGSCSSSSYGIDLNRNFPFHWNSAPGGSSGNPCASTYRGPTRASEPETRNILAYVAGAPDANGVYQGGVFPDRRGDGVSVAAPLDYRGLFLDMHSYSRLVMWPWGDTSQMAPNGPALRTLGRRMAYFNGYRPQQFDELYVSDGTTADTLYGLLGVPSYTFELGTEFFQSCSYFESTVLPGNLAALRFAARTLRAPYQLPSGPSTTTMAITPGSVRAGTPVTVTATVDDRQFNQSNGAEPIQTIASAAAYLDMPPWAIGASRIALRASDNSFNSAVENVTGTVSTTGLSAGTHIIFVQGTDSAGRPGVPKALRFTVTTGG